MIERIVAAVLLAGTIPAIAQQRCVASIDWGGASTASGERPDPRKATVAHKTLPFGTCLLIATVDRSSVARVNDRGPFNDRCLDLNERAARDLGKWHKNPKKRGLVRVSYRVIPCPID